MATYATIAEARGLYGDDYVSISEDDEAVFGESLTAASDRIWEIAEDYFPDGRPTAEEAPASWKLYCVDIAIYLSSKTAGRGTKEKGERYDEAIRLLERKYPGPGETESSAPSSTLGASISAGGRVFTRTTMSELL